MKVRSLKFNSVVNLIKTILGIIFPLITFPYASRVLGATGIGKVDYANSISNYFILFASLGLIRSEKGQKSEMTRKNWISW